MWAPGWKTQKACVPCPLRGGKLVEQVGSRQKYQYNRGPASSSTSGVPAGQWQGRGGRGQQGVLSFAGWEGDIGQFCHKTPQNAILLVLWTHRFGSRLSYFFFLARIFLPQPDFSPSGNALPTLSLQQLGDAHLNNNRHSPLPSSLPSFLAWPELCLGSLGTTTPPPPCLRKASQRNRSRPQSLGGLTWDCTPRSQDNFLSPMVYPQGRLKICPPRNPTAQIEGKECLLIQRQARRSWPVTWLHTALGDQVNGTNARALHILRQEFRPAI